VPTCPLPHCPGPKVGQMLQLQCKQQEAAPPATRHSLHLLWGASKPEPLQQHGLTQEG
jgi:hypothetical protein